MEILLAGIVGPFVVAAVAMFLGAFDDNRMDL